MSSFTDWVESVFNGETFEVVKEPEDSKSCSPFGENPSRTTDNSKTKTASASKSNNKECAYFLDDKVSGSRYKKTGNLPHGLNKLVTTLSVGDLLQAELLPNVTYGTSLQFFEHEKLEFFKVTVNGRIERMYPYKDRYSIEVDDGTGRITCMFPNEHRFKELKKKAKEEMYLMKDLFLEDRSNNLLKANYVLARKGFLLMSATPLSCELKCNDNVTVLGNMKEYKEKRYIFVDKIYKDVDPKVFAL